MNVLVIDIGTSSMRGIIYHENAEKMFVKQVKYQPTHGKNGLVEQDADDFVEAMMEIAQASGIYAKENGKKIDAISVTSQRSAIIPIDCEGRPLMKTIMWQDTRNKEECKKLEKYNDEIFKLSGAKVNCVFSGGKMIWVKKCKPEVYQNVYKFVNIPEYLIHMLTGKYITDYTYGSRSNLMNLMSCEWDDRLLELFQVKREQLCDLVPPGSVMGYVTEKFSIMTGIEAGIPVISAGGDQQCAAIGRGVSQEGDLSIVTGTGAFLVAVCDKIPENLVSDVICNCSSIPGKYIIEANVLACCSAFDWFCDIFYGSRTVDFDLINEQLKEMDDKNGDCIVLPFFQGRGAPYWDSSARAVFSGISLGTTREEMLKAVLEGIFIEIRNNIENFYKYVKVKSGYISGGMTNSDEMNQMQADIYGIPLCCMEDSEATSMGAFIMALKNFYKEKDVSFIFKEVAKRKEQIYLPREEKKEAYEARRKEFNTLYSKLY